MKKEWKKPELTVLMRTMPEENILVTCKNDSIATQSANTLDANCRVTDGSCAACNDLLAS